MVHGSLFRTFCSWCLTARECLEMHGGDQPLVHLFRNGNRDIEGKGEILSILLTGHISRCHQPTHIRGRSTDPELVFEFLFSLIEPFEEVLISHLDLVRA